ncbi:MAG TPA: branched-chain amino acid ABC transporter permease [Thermoleophilia bacterium]|nr:branched-chain amino acid ABC transporter permease [Thermoleophilia bacterium]
MANWIQLLVTGITTGSLYALIALGFVTIYRSSRIVNMAQGSFVMFGGLFTFSMLMEIGMPFWLAGVVGTVLVVLLGVLMYQIVLKPVLKISLVSMILCTVALSLLFENLSLVKYGGYTKQLPSFTGDATFEVGGVFISRQSLWMIGIMIVILAILYTINNRTTIGKRMTATATNPVAASLSGINVSRMVLLSFFISAVIGAIGGITISGYVGGINYAAGGLYGMMGFIAAVLGGWGSSLGAVVGALVLGIAQALSTGLVPAGYKNVVAFVILLIVLYFRPQGLLGTKVPEGEV